ncbi:MAG: thiol:disulfide interchange protein DsbA/DsbL [Pseudomonadota bacterium]
MVKTMQKWVRLIGLSGIGLWLISCEAPPPAATVSAERSTITAEQPVPQKVTLTLYFWYGCPHCFEFRHYLQPWLEDWSDRVNFSRVPIALRPDWVDHARAFYAAQALGVLPRFHPALYDALHVQKRELNSVAALSEFAGSLGIDAAAFRTAMLAPETTAALRRDNAAVKRLGIYTTPTLIVDDRQRISASAKGGYDALLASAEDLIEQKLAQSVPVH